MLAVFIERKKSDGKKLPFQCICKFKNTMCPVLANRKLFQYALKIQKFKHFCHSSIFYSTDDFRNYIFKLPAILAISTKKMTEMILSYLTVNLTARYTTSIQNKCRVLSSSEILGIICYRNPALD